MPLRPQSLARFGRPRGSRTAGFTLIELLVAISVIAVLMGVLLPALGAARDTARQVREQKSGNDLITAYLLYAHDYGGTLLPGYTPGAWVDEFAPPGSAQIAVVDAAGDRIYGVPARRYPWRIAPYLDYNFEGLYLDKRVLQRYRERDDYRYVISVSPSYGLNSGFLGGDADRYGFNQAVVGAWGSFYATRADQVRQPAEMLTFVSARGVNPDGGDSVPGYFRVDSPYRTARAWDTEFKTDDVPSRYGNVDFRFSSKAATACLDGHVELLGFEQMQDMRRWSPRAVRPDWTLGSR